jgi:hypothetical protein
MPTLIEKARYNRLAALARRAGDARPTRPNPIA